MENDCCFCRGSVEFSFEAIDTKGQPFRYGTCAHCGTVQLLDSHEEAIGLAYAKEYYGQGQNKFREPISTLFNWSKRRLAQHYKKLITAESWVLDIGGGRGDFLNYLHQLGHKKLAGTELQPDDSHNDVIKWYYGGLQDKELNSRQYALVTLFHVFEHLPQPTQLLNDLAGLVAENGYLVIAYPNVASRQYAKYRRHWLHLDPPRHLHLVPPKQLEKALVKKGFELVSTKGFSPVYDPLGYTQSILNKFRRPRDFFYDGTQNRETFGA